MLKQRKESKERRRNEMQKETSLTSVITAGIISSVTILQIAVNAAHTSNIFVL
jgi:hypothetical protein